MDSLAQLAPNWPEISAMLDEALDLPAAERGAWLDALEGVRARHKDTLRALLGATGGRETQDLLNTLPRLATFPPEGVRDSPAGMPMPGMFIGPYRLISELGRGGMGAVWLAERADGALRRCVAVKLPHLVWNSTLADRLVRERDILASLDHPHIARVYDAGVDAHGRPYFAMEFVEGRSIDQYCLEHGLSIRARIGLLLQVCDAVAHAHAHLVIHRDLKPGNVLVTADGAVKLLDFGIAKLMDGDRTEETALTRQAGIGLTIDYASPEQIAGQALGTASDVYSLGVVAFELLARQRPYRLKRGGRAELEQAIAEVAPPRASDVAEAPTDKRALRGDLDAILSKALGKTPEKRYATVAALADDLMRHLDGLPVLARPDSRFYLARKFVARNRVAVASAATVALAVTIGFGVALWQYRDATANLAHAQKAFDRENAARVLYVETLSTIAGWDTATFGEPRSVARMLMRKMEEVSKRFEGQPVPQLGVLHAVNQQLPYMGDHEGSLAVGARYIELLKKSGAHPSHLMLAALQRARTFSTLGRHDEGVAVMREAVATIPNQHEAPHEQVRMQVEFAKMLSKTGLRDESMAVLRAGEAVVAREKRFVEARADVQQMLARLHFGFDELEALRYMRASHESFTTLATASVPQVGFSHWQLGIALSRAGRPAEAEAALREGGRRFDEVYGPVDRDSVSLAGELALALANQGRYDAARAMLVERQAQVDRKPGPDTAVARRALNARRLQIELLAGDIDSARRFSTAEGAVDPNDPHSLVQTIGNAELQRRLGQGEEASKRLGSMLEALPPAFRQGAVAFELRSAQVASLASIEPGEAALAGYRRLIADMRAARATNTWVHERAVESSASILTRQGKWQEGLAALQTLEKGKTGPRIAAPSHTERAESAWRRAAVHHAAGERREAEVLLASARADLAGQHAGSPRNADQMALSAAMSR
ncbi:MAG: serine/threonine protein kinase [Rhizobiales bacterium]|nr:serine/threonine protein kinase [Rhizobacter sp.]